MASDSPSSVLRTVGPDVYSVPPRGVGLFASRPPAPLTPFVGREHELATIEALLARQQVRLLTLTGPGGVGKTRLALRVGDVMAPQFPDGVVFVPLAAVNDADLVGPAIYHALNGWERGVDYSEEGLHRLLAECRLLLILDNFEHVVAAAAQVAALLDTSPTLTILVTSRTALRLSGEQDYLIPPLSLPDREQEVSLPEAEQSEAVRLFLQRAAAARLDGETSPETVRTVARICQYLDGLPLAIELAAARVSHLSPVALLERLERPTTTRLALLTGGRRDQPARHQTLRDTIAWSYDLLDDVEQTFFQDLSLFPGGFTLEAAAYVGGDGFAFGGDGPAGLGGEEDEEPRPPSSLPSAASPPERSDSPTTLDLVASLVAKSLVVHEGEYGGEPRYGMLGTIREFAREQLVASGREAATRQRQVAWALALAARAGSQVKGAEAAFWLEMLEREQANVRVALDWLAQRREGALLARLTGELWQFWHEHAHYAEGRRWVELALELAETASPEHRLRLLTGAGTMAWYQADVAASRERHEQALALAQQIGDRIAEAYELTNLGVHASQLGDRDLAIARFAASLDASNDIADPGPRVLALHNLAFLAWEVADYETAMRYLQDARVTAETHRLGWILPSILAGLGMTSLDTGDAAAAIGYFREGIAHAQARGNLSDLIDGIEGLARVAAQTGQERQATLLYGATDALREALATPFGPEEIAQFTPIAALLRETLGEEGYAAAWTEGRSWTQEQALAAALAIAAAAAPRPRASARRGANPHGLSAREVDVLRLLAAGHSNREIGERLFISATTVARHVANLYRKLGVDSRAKATAFAHRQGMIAPR